MLVISALKTFVKRTFTKHNLVRFKWKMSNKQKTGQQSKQQNNTSLSHFAAASSGNGNASGNFQPCFNPHFPQGPPGRPRPRFGEESINFTPTQYQNASGFSNSLPFSFNSLNFTQNTRPAHHLSQRYYQNQNHVHPSLSRQYFRRNQPDGTTNQSRRGSNNGSVLRKWQQLSPDNQAKPGLIFTLMSYNVLAQQLLVNHRELYKTAKSKDLDWNVRWENIQKELNTLNPDILCLQEVQESHLEDYTSAFAKLGYLGIYKKRTNDKEDGCAIYYRTSMFNLVEHTAIEYFKENVTLLNRDNVAIVAKFSLKTEPKKQFLVANTHLIFNPKRTDVRLAQMQLLVTEMEQMSFLANSSNGNNAYLPVFIAGDLNSRHNSAVYEFITRGSVNYNGLVRAPDKTLIPASLKITDNCQHVDAIAKRGKTASNRENNRTLFNTGLLTHAFRLNSVYNHDNEATTHQDEWLTVDYIFYSGTKKNRDVQLLSRYSLPNLQYLENLHIPNDSLGSDHLCLMAKFKLYF